MTGTSVFLWRGLFGGSLLVQRLRGAAQGQTVTKHQRYTVATLPSLCMNTFQHTDCLVRATFTYIIMLRFFFFFRVLAKLYTTFFLMSSLRMDGPLSCLIYTSVQRTKEEGKKKVIITHRSTPPFNHLPHVIHKMSINYGVMSTLTD